MLSDSESEEVVGRGQSRPEEMAYKESKKLACPHYKSPCPAPIMIMSCQCCADKIHAVPWKEPLPEKSSTADALEINGHDVQSSTLGLNEETKATDDSDQEETEVILDEQIQETEPAFDLQDILSQVGIVTPVEVELSMGNGEEQLENGNFNDRYDGGSDQDLFEECMGPALAQEVSATNDEDADTSLIPDSDPEDNVVNEIEYPPVSDAYDDEEEDAPSLAPSKPAATKAKVCVDDSDEDVDTIPCTPVPVKIKVAVRKSKRSKKKEVEETLAQEEEDTEQASPICDIPSKSKAKKDKKNTMKVNTSDDETSPVREAPKSRAKKDDAKVKKGKVVSSDEEEKNVGDVSDEEEELGSISSSPVPSKPVSAKEQVKKKADSDDDDEASLVKPVTKSDSDLTDFEEDQTVKVLQKSSIKKEKTAVVKKEKTTAVKKEKSPDSDDEQLFVPSKKAILKKAVKVEAKNDGSSSDTSETVELAKAKGKVTEIVDKEKPSTSKKVASELARNKRRSDRQKLSKSEAAARRGVLDSSSDEEDTTGIKKSFTTVKKERKARSQTQSVDTTTTTLEADPEKDAKLKPEASYVILQRLVPEIEAELHNNKFIISLDQSGANDEDLDKDNYDDGDSDSSVRKLSNAIKNLEKFNAKIARKSLEKEKKASAASAKKSSKSQKGKKKGSHSEEEEEKPNSNLSDAMSDEDLKRPKIKLKSFTELLEPGDVSDMDDLQDVKSDGDEKRMKERSDKKPTEEKQDKKGNKKKYAGAVVNLSDSNDSAKDDRMDVLGKDDDDDDDSDEDVSKIKKAKKGSDSSDDSDGMTRITRRNQSRKKTKKQKLDSDSDKESEVVEISSESEDLSDDSDFVSKSKKKRKGKRQHSSSEDEEDKKKKKKKRKRIKVEDSDAESDGSKKSDDSDIQEVEAIPASQRRKQIRGIMSKKELQKSTKEAEKEEEERKKRVLEKQKLFNGIFESAGVENKGKLKRLVLDVDPKTKEPLIEVDESIVTKLKPHQGDGIKFMFTTCFESVEMINKGKAGGCILAHCMGLGKTLQTVAFTHTMLEYKDLTKIKRVLIVCPLNTVGNWYKEFQMWLEDISTEKRPKLHALWEGKNVNERVDALKVWERRGGVGIIHYECFRILVSSLSGKGKTKPKKHHVEAIERCLLDPGPDLVVCDEGHLLKNHKSKLTETLSKIKTIRRIVLTGTPLQNNLVEYHTMVNFVKPNLLGSMKEFTNRFVNPIKNGQCKDSGERDVRIMKRRAHVLHSKLEGCVQRLDYSVLTPYLPPKHEYCIIIKLSDKQKDLYKDYIDKKVPIDAIERGRRILQHYAVLVKILAHPIVLTMKRAIQNSDLSDEEEEGSIKDFIDDDVTDDKTTTSDADDDSDIECLDEDKPAKQVNKRKTRSRKNEPDEEEDPEDSNDAKPKSTPLGNEWWCSHFDKKEDMYDTTLSGKLVVLQEILKTCEAIGDKVLVFSQYLTTLNIIEEFLGEWDAEAVVNNKEDDKPRTFPPTASASNGRWRPNIEYFRIDGSTKTNDRQKHCETFNKKSTSRAKLFLISTKAGGLGINLFGANRVVIFDASWNPSNDMQSIFRVYRFGQLKPCYIYRFVAQATMEEKIYNRQVVKLSLSSRVVDEHQVERHFKFDDINEMYRFNPDEKTERPTPPVPKDRLLADLLISHKEWVDSYFEHDTLLMNKEEETLTEEERKAAWDEYQNENERRVLPPMHATDTQTYNRIMEKLLIRFPSAEMDQIRASALVVLQKIQELRVLIQRLNYEGFTQNEAWKADIEFKIKRLQSWIQTALGVKDGVGPTGSPLDNDIVPRVNMNPNYIAPGILRQLQRQAQQQGMGPSAASFAHPNAGNIQRQMMNSLQIARTMSNGAPGGRVAGITANNGRLPPVPGMIPFQYPQFVYQNGNANPTIGGGTADNPVDLD